MKKYIILTMFMLQNHFINCQSYDFNWLLAGHILTGQPVNNQGITMDFSTGSPSINQIDRPIVLSDGNCVMSDSLGHLAFYTNGCQLYNAQNELIENGETLNAGEVHDAYCSGPAPYFPLFNSYLSIPFPGHPNMYYLLYQFIDAQDFAVQKLLYAIIDMNANNGAGKVLEKDVEILQVNWMSPFTACRHGNGRDWWVQTYEIDQPVYHRFILSDQGITVAGQQTIPDRPLSWAAPFGNFDFVFFSHDGTKYIEVDGYRGINMFDFNRCTGELSNLLTTEYFDFSQFQDVFMNGGALSPNDRFLYIPIEEYATEATFKSYVVQYDLEMPEWYMQGDTVGRYDGFFDTLTGDRPSFGFIVNGPDGKIYMNARNTNSLHVINLPDLPGMTCNLVPRGFALPVYMNIATFPYFPHYRTYDFADSPCDTLGINAPVGLKEVGKEASGMCQVYPNPSAGEVTLAFAEQPPKDCTVFVYNVLGQVVYRQQVQLSKGEYDLVGLPNGAYWLQVRGQGRVGFCTKLMINR